MKEMSATATTSQLAQTRKTLRNRIQTNQEFIVRTLQEFYNRPGKMETLIPILTGTSRISLRLIDWFVTNYSKKNNVNYILRDDTGREQLFVVFFNYKRELKAWSKRCFDPFCRRERILFQARGMPTIETTIGQLNFFKWAIENGVITYMLEHADEIEHDMNTSSREHVTRDAARTPTGRRKRKEMSSSATKTVNRHDVPVTLMF